MATDSTNLPLGETNVDAGSDMTGSELDLTSVQLAQVEGAQPVELPKGNQVVLVPVQPGQVIQLPTDSTSGLLAKIGPEGNLAIIVDGRTIILQGYLKANDQTPVKIVTNDGDTVDVADVIAATDPSLDIQTAAGPATGGQGDGADGSGIFIPFTTGPGLGGIGAEGVLGATALQYRLIDNDFEEFPLGDEDSVPDFTITFDVLGGIVNEDDLGLPNQEPDDLLAAKFVFQEGGNEGVGNDPFDPDDREQGSQDNPPDDLDNEDKNGNGADPDREPLSTVATVKVDFHGDVPGKLEVDLTKLPVGLTSEGELISYAIDPAVAGVHGNGIFGYVENGGGAGYQDGIDRLVFEVHVDKDESDSEFKVTFTLHDNIDNEAPDANDDGKPDLLGANEQLLDLPVHFKITDSDGSSVGGTLPIQVEDDKPFFGEVVDVGEDMQIIDVNAVVTHDETEGVDGDADDVDPVDLLPLVPELGPKIVAAGFSLPFESEGATIGTAQTQVKASFGADQATQEHLKGAGDATTRNSVFGTLQDRSDLTEDGNFLGNAVENERPFELFMIENGSGKDAVPAEDNLSTPLVEGNLTIADQPTNATVTWFGNSEQVFLHQIDAQTVVGYILVDGYDGGEEQLQALEAVPGEGKELVFVLHIDDNGVLSFAQFHQLNHNTDGPTPADHDDTQVGSGQFNILGEDGTPLIHVRISDFDGDHATQPVNVVIQDDGPVFKQVDYDLCQTDDNGVEPTHVLDHFDDLSGWTVLTGSNASIVNNPGTTDPQPDPHKQALLIAEGADQTDIESFFGLLPGALDAVADDGDAANGTENPTDGSAIKQTFNVHAGDVLTVKFNFLEDESDGEGGDEAPSFQDFAFIVIGDQVFRLSNVGEADVPSSANSGSFSWDEESGYLTFTYTFTASGPVQVGFGVMDESDEIVDPGLLIDELKIGPGCEGAIDEDALPNGIEGGPGDGVGGVSVGGNIEFDFGVDRPGLLSIDGLSIADDKGAAIAFADLTTADGNGVEWGTKSDPDVDGWVTWTAIEEGTGDPVFVFKLDTSGAGQGDFVFELKQALSHPFTDDPTDPADTNTAWEDNLHFNFQVKATDVDGDWTFGKIAISVDDDSPKATCDVDCVTEGETEGEPNYASGNVVTGVDGGLDTDGNGLDGNKDHPGADQPYTISKLVHEGVEYTLIDNGDGTFSAAKDGVPIDGSGDESFDGSKLTIETAEGGTFEIVMVSPTQSEVGDYKYTVPADADHDIEHHIGPDVDASHNFGNLAAWTGAFSAAGINVSALAGSLTIKDPVNVTPEPGAPSQYAGIGVSGGGGGDEQEVDTDGNFIFSEGLKLDIDNGKFPGGVDNISLTIGALFDGQQYDNGNQEILQWSVWNGFILVASGQIVGDYDGLVTLDIDTGGAKFDHVILKPIDNGQGDNKGESFGDNSDFLLVNAEVCCPLDKFTEEFEYTLRDADGDESSATLKIDVKDTQPELPHYSPEISVCINVDEDGLPDGIGNSDSPFDAPGNSASTSGNIPFTPGFDPVTIELSVGLGGDTGLETVHGDNVFAAWDAASKTLIGYIEGTNPSDPANQVFKMTITDPQTGAFTFELLQPLEHDDVEGFGKSAINDTENKHDLSFIVNVQIEDKDCDVITTKIKVTIDDDMPVITECHDEQGNDINLLVNGSFEKLGDEDGGVLEHGGAWGVFSQIPGWKSGNATDPTQAGLEIQADGAVPQIDAKDGEHYVELDSDALNLGDGKPASTNASIYQDVDTVDGNNYVLSFSYSPRVGVPSTDGVEVWFDGVKVATIDSGKVGEWKEYTFVVEAGEDPADTTPDSSRLEFKAVGTSDSLGGFIDDVSLTACALVDEDALPNGIEGGPGDDGPIGACFSGSLGVDFGADGGKEIEFFENGQPNLKSHGQTVHYNWVDGPNGTGTLYGYTGGNPWDSSKWVFTVAVQSLDNGGEYKFTLLKPLDHPDTDNIPNNENDHGKGSFEDNLVFELKFKATDNDGDTVTGHLKINVDDDSPKITDGTGSISLHTDETLGGGADVLPNPGTTAENDEAGAVIPGVISGQVAGTAIGFSQGSAAGLFNGQYGADGPGAGSPAYSLTINGGATGLTDTATNTAIVLVEGLNGVVLGKANGGAGPVVFAFSVDGSGNVTMVQYRAVNHGANEAAPGDHDEAIFMSPGVLGVTLKITDYDGDAVSLTRDISGSISIDDDGPHANCDIDHVTEGAGNYATGNVVTGANPENPELGTDGNGTDGNPDSPGTDGPYTISKLTHGGDVYELSADGTTLTKNGGPLTDGDTFIGGKLTITTEEGATFEIIMVSGDQSDVGEYKYTAGPNPIHAEDVQYGADSLAESITLAQAGVGAYEASFGPGVTLQAIGGSLAVKTVNVDPKAGPLGAEDYGGIGVASSQGDEAEVDQLDQGEALKINFAAPTDNAEIQLGALFNGVQYDSGFQEIVKWEALAADGVTVIASGQILGVNNGLVVLDVDTDVPFSSIKLTPLNNGAGNSGNNSDFVILGVEVCNEEPVKEEFGYTLRDGDGDESSAALKICVEDTYPRPPEGTGTLAFSVDEDGLPNGIGNDGSPNDIPSNSASFAGLIPFIPGADPVSIELSIGNGGDTELKTLSGQSIFGAWDAASKTLIGYIQGTDPSDAGNQIFKMKVTNDATGAFTFDLLKPIKHADGGQDDNTENDLDPEFLVNVQIEDKDCDVAFTAVKISIDDDMPVIKELKKEGDGLVVHDESIGEQGEDQENGDLPQVFKNLTSDKIIGWAEDEEGESSIDASFAYGADGPGFTDVSLTLSSNSGVNSGLFTTAGAQIWLFKEGDLVVGRVGSGVNGVTPNAGGAIAFAVNAQDDGDLQVAQYLSLKHTEDDETNETVVLQDNALQATLSVTDADGDTVTKSVDISSLIKFADAAPDAKNDSDSVEEDGPTIAYGNVVTGKDGGLGTDGNSTDGVKDEPDSDGLKSLTWFEQGTSTPDANGIIVGKYGTLTVEADGDYKYELNNGLKEVQGLSEGEIVQEQFKYTIRDGDNDPDSATLTITIKGNDDTVTITGLNPAASGGDAIVKEEALNAAPTANTDGSNPSSTEETGKGSFFVSAPDGLDDIVVSSADGSPSVQIVNNGAFLGTKSFTTDLGNKLTITGFNAGTGEVTYEYLLNNDETHPDKTTKDSIFEHFKISADDVDGSSANATLSIQIVDDMPTAIGDKDEVFEGGPTIADGNLITGVGGSDANGTDGNKDTPGADDPAGISKVTNFAAASIDPDNDGESIAGKWGKLTVDEAGNYKYELDSNNAEVKELGVGDQLTETFNYTLKDEDGDTSTSFLNIVIKGTNEPPTIDFDPQNPDIKNGKAVVSDEGLAGGNKDSDPNPADETDNAFANGSFVVGDPDLPADTLTVSLIQPANPSGLFFGGVEATWVLDPSGHVLHGQVGGVDAINVTITDSGDGLHYNYTVDLLKPLDHPVAGVEDEINFNVTVKVTDSHAESDTAILSIQIEDDSPIAELIASGGIIIVDESVGPSLIDPLADDEAASAEDDIGYFKSTVGSLFVGIADFGADVPGSTEFSLDVNAGNSLLVDTQSDQQVVFSVNGITGDVEGHAGLGGPLVLTISIDPTDGVVEVHQYRAVKHDNPSDPDEDASPATIASGIIDVVLTVTDKDGDSDTATLDLGARIQFQDDGPTAVDDNVDVAPGVSGTADILFIVDISGSMTNEGGQIGSDVPGFSDDRLGLARYSMQQLLENHPEILNVQFVKFDDAIGTPSSVWLTRADALLYILDDDNFDGGGRTNYDIALAEAMDVYDNGGDPRPGGEADQTLVYFMSDGVPNEDDDPGITNEGTGDSEVSIAEWESFVTNPANGITHVFAIGLGDGVNVDNLEPVAYPNDDTTPADGTEDHVVVIPTANLTDLTETLDALLGTVIPPAGGDVTTNDDPGTDGFDAPELVSVTYNFVTQTFSPGDTEFTIDLGAGRGSLDIHDDGTYTYTPPSGDLIDGTPFFVEYTIRDGDGDTSTAKLLFDLEAPPTTDLNGVVVGDDVAVGFTEQTPQAIAPAATIAADVTDLVSMTVTLTNRPNGNGVESLSVPGGPLPGGLVANYTAATGVLLITGAASVADYQAVLQSILYNNTSDTPNTTPRSVTVVVNDGTSNSIANISTITVTPVNDAPDAVAPVGPYAATEQVNLALHGTGLSISDVDAGGGSMTVTLSVGFGILSVSAGNSGVSIGGNNSSSVTLTGTVAEINSLLDDSSTGTISYNANSDSPPTSTQLTLHVNDEGNTGGGDLTDDAFVTINITNTPEPPTTNAGSGSGNEDAASISVSLSGNDVDGTVTSFKVTSLPTGGKLYADPGLSNEITLNETVSAIANAATLFFVPTANSNGSPTFEYAAIDNDGQEDATPAVATITVTPVNDLPNAVDDILITRDVDSDDSDNYTIQSAWLLRNDTDGDAARFVSQVDRTGLDDPNTVINGTVSNFTIDPDGSDNFTYKASDGSDTDQATVDVQNDGSGSFDGGAGSEIIVGTAAGETLNGNDGNDILAGGGGNDTLNGGKGDDWLVYDPADGTINGGDDFDTLRFESAQDIDIDAGAIIGRVTNIEAIDLRNGSATDDLGNTGGDNQISAADVIAMADGDDTIYIMGDGDGSGGGADDEVRLDGTWVAGATAVVNDPAHPEINGLTFTQYTSGTATLFIQNTIDVD